MRNIPKVVEALKEVSDYLVKGSYREIVDGFIRELENPDIDDSELRQLKTKLSKDYLFDKKYLGEAYAPDFVGDGTAFAWWNYLYSVAEICQNNL